MEPSIELLREKDIPLMVNLTKKCFYNDNIFEDVRENDKWGEFGKLYKYTSRDKSTYGAYDGDKLIGGLVTSDYWRLKPNKPIFQIAFGDEDHPTKLEQQIFDYFNNLGPNLRYLVILCVHPDYQRQGIASILIDRAIKDYPESIIGVDITNKNSLPMYIKRGFEIIPLTSTYFLGSKQRSVKNEEVNRNSFTDSVFVSDCMLSHGHGKEN